MNKNFAFFLALVAFIAVFAVVVMVKVPRKGVVGVENIDTSIPESTGVSLAQQ